MYYFTGHTAETADIVDWTTATSEDQESLSGVAIEHGDVVYGLVLCQNGAGLETLKATNAVSMVTEPPGITNAQLEIGN